MKKISGRALVIEDNYVYLLYRRRLINGEFIEYYAVPGGKLEIDESIEECTKREIKEELGIDIELISYLGKVEDDSSIGHIYSAKKLTNDFHLGGEESEVNNENNYYEIKKVPFDEIESLNIAKENKEMIKKAFESIGGKNE